MFQLWNVADGSLARVCSREGKDSMDSLHGGWASDLHFSPDDTLLVSIGGYIKVRPGGAQEPHAKHAQRVDLYGIGSVALMLGGARHRSS